MNTYVAFMRAINVAGHRVVKMDALCQAFTAAGCRNVKSYIQSGNVIFDSRLSDEAVVLHRLQGKLRNLLGQDTVIFLRNLAEIADLVARNPFRKFNAEPNVKLYVAFLAVHPRIKPQFPLLLPKEGLEAFAMEGREIFVVSRRSPNGSYGFPNKFIEKEVGAPATTRNWNTLIRIVAHADSM